MKKTKFQRITAFVLALVVVLGGCVISVSADNSSVSNTTTSDIKALLNAISYSEYVALQGEVPYAEEDVILDATKNFSFVMKNGEAPAAEAEA